MKINLTAVIEGICVTGLITGLLAIASVAEYCPFTFEDAFNFVLGLFG